MGKYKIAKSGIIEQDGEFICTSSVVELLNQKDARIKELEKNQPLCDECTFAALISQLKEANDLLIYVELKFQASSCHCERPQFECTTCKVKRKLSEYQAKYKGE